jgi:hypothetical protein
MISALVEPQRHSVHWLVLKDGEYAEARRSGLIDLGPDDLLDRIHWP